VSARTQTHQVARLVDDAVGALAEGKLALLLVPVEKGHRRHGGGGRPAASLRGLIHRELCTPLSSPHPHAWARMLARAPRPRLVQTSGQPRMPTKDVMRCLPRMLRLPPHALRMARPCPKLLSSACAVLCCVVRPLRRPSAASSAAAASAPSAQLL